MMSISCFIKCVLKEKNVATIKKKKHTYLTYYGLEQQDTYVLKDGVVKTSVILLIYSKAKSLFT